MLDQVFFSLMSLTSLILACALLWCYRQHRKVHVLLWSIAAVVLFAAGILLAVGGLNVLSQPYVPVIAAIIPAFFADGVLFVIFKKRTYGVGYFAYAVLLIAFLSLSKALNLASATPLLIAIHAPSGLIIFILPIIAVFTKRTSMSGSLLGIGGLLIGIGGMALATLGTNTPLLPVAIVLEIIAPLLFFVALLFTLGILLTPGWGFVEAPLRVRH